MLSSVRQKAPLAHVAHLDRKQDNDAFLGAVVTIRAKKEREERTTSRTT